MSKTLTSPIIVTETIFKDDETPLCFDCQMPAVGFQIKCNCGCDEIWCQPCYYKHYKNFASKINLKKWTDGDVDVKDTFLNALN